MNTSNIHKAHKKKHAGRPSSASSESPTASSIALIRSSAIGLGCSLGVALLFLLVATLVAHRSTDPNALAYPLSLAALYMTALFAGIVTVRIHGSSALICGLISGALLLLAGLLVGICLPAEEAIRGSHALLFRIPIPLLSVGGAFLAQKRPKNHQHRRR